MIQASGEIFFIQIYLFQVQNKEFCFAIYLHFAVYLHFYRKIHIKVNINSCICLSVFNFFSCCYLPLISFVFQKCCHLVGRCFSFSTRVIKGSRKNFKLPLPLQLPKKPPNSLKI